MACVHAVLHAVIQLSLLQFACLNLTDSLVQQDLVGSHVWKMFALLSCCGQTHISRGKHTSP